MARRRYQTGCLFKRGKRKKVWVARWREYVIREGGSRGRLHRSAVLGAVGDIPTLRQAKALLERRLQPMNQGLLQPQSTMRFSDFAQGEWTALVLPTHKLSTQHGYRVVLERHLLPYFGSSRLCDITKLEIQHFVAEKFHQGLAWQTVRNTWILLSSILDSAAEYGYITLNPARGVKFPPQGPAKAPQILSAEALARLREYLREPFKTMVALTVLTGLRIGELLALRWRSVDLDTGILHVSESVFQGEFQKPKSKRAVRTLPIGPVTRQLLEDHHRRSMSIQPDDLVFPHRNGQPYRESNLLQGVLQPTGKAAGVGRVTWHQFRHIHATLLHELGVPARVAQEQLGHATIETTLKVYTHTIPETHRRAIEDLERVLFPNVPKLVDSRDKAGSLIQ